MDSLADRLKSLGFKTASSLQTPKRQQFPSLEEAIGGEVLKNSGGSFVMKEKLYPFDYRHGIVTFTSEITTITINQAAKIHRSSPSLDKMLFIDTETSGLSGGAGTFAFLVGIGKFQESGFNLQQLIIRDPSEEIAMLLYLSNLINDETVFVSFNGKSFDIPLIQNRLIVNRIPIRLRDLPHLDILHISRRLWRRQLASCSLKDLEGAILQFARTSEDVPGWMIPDIYFEYLHNGDPGPMTDIVYHNDQDIVSLAALFIHITELLEANTSNSDISTNDLIAISRVYWDMRSFEIAGNILKTCLDRKMNSDQKIAINSMLGQYHKHKKSSTEALVFWREAAENGDPYSCIELAMYYEHEMKDFSTALEWSSRCKSNIENEKNRQINVTFIKALDKRIRRLQLKGSKNVQKDDQG